MYNRPTKRKADRPQGPRYTQPDPALYIQAYEAEIIRGPQAHSLALSLEAEHAESDGAMGVKTRLVNLNPSVIEGGGSQGVWVDRYDARLLLDTLPSSTPGGGAPVLGDNARLSPTGWSDLPSDSEDTFFFSPDEVEDYHREKRRRMIDESREERLRALRAETADDIVGEDDPWGGSDEEPDEAQKELMRRTATHILNSPNPAQLEMRILANHGADKRFAFLRGRWSRAWKTAKGRIRLEQEAAKTQTNEEKKVGLGGLAGYGDSDASGEESEAEERQENQVHLEIAGNEVVSDSPTSLTEEAVKEARRAKAKAWAEQRRAAKAKEIQ